MEEVIKHLAGELRSHRPSNGTLGNIYRDALALQVMEALPGIGKGVWNPNELLDHVIRSRNPGQPIETLKGSYGGSVSITSIVLPALAGVTPDFIGERKCVVGEDKALVSGLARVDYKIEDLVTRTQSLVGAFYTRPGKTVLEALTEYRALHPEVLQFRAVRSPFGLVLKELNGVAGVRDVGWMVAVADEEFRPLASRDTLGVKVEQGMRLLFSFRRGPGQVVERARKQFG